MKDSINDLTYDELLTKKEELSRKLLDLRINKVMGHVENPLQLRIMRRSIARLNTIIHEYALKIRKK
ncbi:MAG: 50S ribosomal protein L29 [Spirochaetia bacterium]|jgi:large subunit ribosomal protein L29|nr:50S ribosomal protein L29 [Spirochaetia bacterium]